LGRIAKKRKDSAGGNKTEGWRSPPKTKNPPHTPPSQARINPRPNAGKKKEKIQMADTTTNEKKRAITTTQRIGTTWELGRVQGKPESNNKRPIKGKKKRRSYRSRRLKGGIGRLIRGVFNREG